LQAHLQQGTGFRSERFGQVKGVLLGVTSDIARLEGRRAALLAELDKVRRPIVLSVTLPGHPPDRLLGCG
jgi:hypothetical protein